jgi:putative ABC transport system ATP-binding protein
MLRVALLGIRGRAGAFAGAFVALFVAAVLVMACGVLLESGIRAHAPVERYAAATAVIAGDQSVGEDNDIVLTERARVDASLAERVGFVFQAFNLMPALTVAQNISLPLRLAGRRPDRAWMREVVERTGLAKRLRHRPAQLSGGQQQRVAFARALVTRPEVLFADEPTGALDTHTSAEILALLREIVDRDGQTIVMVTHDPVAVEYADRSVHFEDGRVVG